MILALDIGGTNIRSAVVNGSKVLEYRKVRTPEKKKDILKKIFEAVEGYEKFDAIGVSVAGFERNGIVQQALNTDINGISLSGLLKKRYGVHVEVENDANCAAIAEFHHGAGKGVNNFVLLTLGTGIGGGAIIGGRLCKGRGGAIEPGSMVIEDGKIFEHLASGDASVVLARKMGFKGISSLELEKKANEGNKKAIAVYEKIGGYLGLGLSNLAYLFDPEIFILGGGFSRVKHIHAPTHAAFGRHYLLSPKPKIMKAKFGDDAGLIGAGLLFRK